MFANFFFGQRANARVDDRFEFPSTVAIIEDDGPKFLPIEEIRRRLGSTPEEIEQRVRDLAEALS